MVCVPPKAWEGRRKADWTASVVLPLASLRTPRHTAIAWPCALAAKSIPASMKWPVVPIWRIAPQWPEVPRARARIVSGPVIAAGRPLAVASAPRHDHLPAAADRDGRPSDHEPSVRDAHRGAPRLPRALHRGTDRAGARPGQRRGPVGAHRELELDVGAARHRSRRRPGRGTRRRRQQSGHGQGGDDKAVAENGHNSKAPMDHRLTAAGRGARR